MCAACTTAEQNPWSGLVNTNCPNCRARSLAKRPEWVAAREAGQMLAPYRAALEKAFGEEGSRSGHEMVERWDAVLKGTR